MKLMNVTKFQSAFLLLKTALKIYLELLLDGLSELADFGVDAV